MKGIKMGIKTGNCYKSSILLLFYDVKQTIVWKFRFQICKCKQCFSLDLRTIFQHI